MKKLTNLLRKSNIAAWTFAIGGIALMVLIAFWR